MHSNEMSFVYSNVSGKIFASIERSTRKTGAENCSNSVEEFKTQTFAKYSREPIICDHSTLKTGRDKTRHQPKDQTEPLASMKKN